MAPFTSGETSWNSPAGQTSAAKAGSGKKTFTVEGVTITHPEREIFPGTGISKGDVAIYYAKAMPYMLPFASKRLISLLRCTAGLGGECFFQRAPLLGARGPIHSLAVDHNGSTHHYMYVDSPAGIIALVQMGALEFHGWQSKITALNKPDQMIFDFDPADNVPFEAVKRAAQDVRNRLKDVGLVSFPRLTGGKGIHVVVPIHPHHGWDAVRAFTMDLAQQMAHDAPESYIATMSKEKRKGKIFVDYLRNDFSATGIIPFSLRARAKAPVAVLLAWNELGKIESAAQFHCGNVEQRLNKQTENLVHEFLSARQALKL